MTGIACFFLTPVGRFRRSLRRYVASDGAPCPLPCGYHDASFRLDELPETDRHVSGDVWPHDDPRWPTHCRCGYAFDDTGFRQLFHETIYRRSDTGAELILDEAPAGAMWDASWLRDVKPHSERSPDGRVLMLRTPGGDWCIDSSATNGPGWTRTGEPPRVTASPSILLRDHRTNAESYHGWLRDGVLVPC